MNWQYVQAKKGGSVPGGSAKQEQNMSRGGLLRSPGLRRTAGIVLKCAISVGILGLIFSKMPVRRVMSVLRDADIPLLVLGYLIMLLAQAAGAARLHVLTRQLGFTFDRFALFRISLAGTFYRMAIPGNVGGGIIRWYRLAREEGRPVDALNAMLYDRLIHASAMLGLGAICLVTDGSISAKAAWWSAAGILILGLLPRLGIFLLTFKGGFVRLLVSAVRHRLSPALQARLAQVTGRTDMLGTLPGHVRLQVWSWALAVVLLNGFFFCLLAMGLHLHIRAATLIWVRAVVFVLAMLPVTIGGLGVREGALLVLLAPYGVLPDQAVAFSLLYFLGTLLLAVLGGVFELLHIMDRRSATVRPATEQPTANAIANPLAEKEHPLP